MQRVFSISVPQELFDALTARSKASGVPRSKLVADAIKKSLEEAS